jgi:hypothetical protein
MAEIHTLSKLLEANDKLLKEKFSFRAFKIFSSDIISIPQDPILKSSILHLGDFSQLQINPISYSLKMIPFKFKFCIHTRESKFWQTSMYASILK